MINEEGIKQSLKTIVNDEPGKLTFFDGLDKDAAPRPFVPSEKLLERIRRDKAKRKRYTAGMAASAVACLVFAILTAISYTPNHISPVIYSAANKPVQLMMTDIPQQIQETGGTVSLISIFLILAVASAAFFVVFLLLKRKAAR